MARTDEPAVSLQATDLEVENLRSCINDLVGVLSLRALWAGGDRLRIAEILAESLSAVLGTEFVYVRLLADGTGAPREVFRAGPAVDITPTVEEVSQVLSTWSGEALNLGVGITRRSVGGQKMTLVAHHLGLRGDFGMVMLGSSRHAFPSATERLLINVAGSQALIGLQEEARLSEQRARSAELDRLVAQRTFELALTNKMLRRSEALLKEGQRLSRTGSVAWNPSKNEIAWSEEIGSLFDIRPEDAFSAESLFARLHPADREACRLLLSAAANGDLTSREHEFRIVDRTGGVRNLHLVWRTMGEGAADFEYLVAVQDLTERRRAEAAVLAFNLRLGEMRDELAHANRLATVGQLSAAISHDVRQPLTGVMLSGRSALNWLSASPPNVQAAERALQRVLNGGQRATDILDRTKAFARKSAADREAVRLDEIVHDTVALVDHDARHRGIVISTDLHGSPTIIADRVQMQQVVMNLVVNAVDAIASSCEEGGRITIRARVDDEARIVMEVQDSGPGIPLSKRDRLFEAFFSTKPEGLGMGLAICRDIIASHGGSLELLDDIIPGATFRVALPLAVAPDAA